MRDFFLLKYIVLVLILGLSVAEVVSAQSVSCNLYVAFHDDVGKNDISEGVITKAYRLNSKNQIISKRGLKAVETFHKSTISYADDPNMEKEFPILTFEGLREGNYEIVSNKNDYKKSRELYKHTCPVNDKLLWILIFKNNSPEIDKQTGGNLSLLDKNAVEAYPTDIVSSPIKQKEPTSKPVPKLIYGGILNGKAITLAKPVYPLEAKAVKASGEVSVEITIDEKGEVISANAVSGHMLLRTAAVKAARESKFSPTLISGQPVKVKGVINYNFTP